jgi:hypothetical protein
MPPEPYEYQGPARIGSGCRGYSIEKPSPGQTPLLAPRGARVLVRAESEPVAGERFRHLSAALPDHRVGDIWIPRLPAPPRSRCHERDRPRATTGTIRLERAPIVFGRGPCRRQSRRRRASAAFWRLGRPGPAGRSALLWRRGPAANRGEVGSGARGHPAAAGGWFSASRLISRLAIADLEKLRYSGVNGRSFRCCVRSVGIGLWGGDVQASGTERDA